MPLPHEQHRDWETCKTVIGHQTWHWKTDAGQHNTPMIHQSGTLTATFAKLPEGISAERIKAALEWVLDAKALMQQGDDAGFTISIPCPRLCDFLDSFGLTGIDLQAVGEELLISEQALSPKNIPDYHYVRNRTGTEIYVYVSAAQNADLLREKLQAEGIKIRAVEPRERKWRITIPGTERDKLVALGITIHEPPSQAKAI